MRKLLAILLLALSFSAQAVDVTISMTAAEIDRFKVAVGEEKKLKEVDGITPRNATNAEAKQFVVNKVREFVVNHERAKAVDAANAAIVVPAFDPQ